MELSLFSVSYAGFWGQDKLDLDAFAAQAAECGYQAVMLAGKRPHLSPLDWPPERVAELRDTLQQRGLRCAVIAAYTDFAGTGAAEVPHVELQIAYIESLARLGAQLGADAIRLFTAYETASDSPQTLWSRTVPVLREICDRTAAHGLTVAVQNHHDIAVHTDALLEFLHDVDHPNCRLGFDAWSPALRGEDLYEAARKAAPFTAITTNADYIRLPRFQYRPALVNYERLLPDMVRAVRFGEGFIDYPAFFQGLRDGGFDGIASYEMCSPIRGGGSRDNLNACAAAYVRWMQDHGFAPAG